MFFSKLIQNKIKWAIYYLVILLPWGCVHCNNKKHLPKKGGKNIMYSTLTTRQKNTSPLALPNVSNNCYINAALQILAACYEDEVTKSNHEALKNIIAKINYGAQEELTKGDMHTYLATVSDFHNQYAGGGSFIHFLEYLDKKNPFLARFTEVKDLIVKRGNQLLHHSVRYTSSPFYLLVDAYDSRIQEATTGHFNELLKLREEELATHKEVDQDPPATKNIRQPSQFVAEKAHLINNPSTKYNCIVHKKLTSTLPDKLYVHFMRIGLDKYNPSYDQRNLVGMRKINIQDSAYTLQAFTKSVCNNNTASKIPNHITAFIQCNGQWYTADDTAVTPISTEKAIYESEQGVNFFYKKGNQVK